MRVIVRRPVASAGAAAPHGDSSSGAAMNATYAPGLARETDVDIDGLAATGDVPWAWGGATCLAPEVRYCLVCLARGGVFAAGVREFDLQAGGLARPVAQ
jgi:prolyl oligopeptidase PreP (S9A serine peptidase family)